MEFFGLIFWLVFMAVCLVLVGIGMAIGLVVGALACGVAALLVLLGVFSVSTAIGLLFRRPGPAFRALVYQLSTVGGAVSGVALAGLGSKILGADLTVAQIAIGGGLGGAAGGLVLALLVLWVCETAGRMASGYLREFPQFKLKERNLPVLQD